jgi:hypothetical protein
MRDCVLIFLMMCCVSAFAAAERPATEATLQAVNTNVQQLQTNVQSVNSSVAALHSVVQSLDGEVRNYYGGLEYVLLALVQAIYFALGVALFYVFDRGRLARDFW